MLYRNINGLVSIKVKDFEKHTKWVLSKDEFQNAHALMGNMYSAFIDGGGLRALHGWPKEKNPFDVGVKDWFIGSSTLHLANICNWICSF